MNTAVCRGGACGGSCLNKAMSVHSPSSKPRFRSSIGTNPTCERLNSGTVPKSVAAIRRSAASRCARGEDEARGGDRDAGGAAPAIETGKLAPCCTTDTVVQAGRAKECRGDAAHAAKIAYSPATTRKGRKRCPASPASSIPQEQQVTVGVVQQRARAAVRIGDHAR